MYVVLYVYNWESTRSEVIANPEWLPHRLRTLNFYLTDSAESSSTLVDMALRGRGLANNGTVKSTILEPSDIIAVYQACKDIQNITENIFLVVQVLNILPLD